MSNPTTQPDRTLPEQIEFAYLTLLGHLENLAARMQEMRDDSEGIDEECVEVLHDLVNRMLCKNYKLRFKLQKQGGAS